MTRARLAVLLLVPGQVILMLADLLVAIREGLQDGGRDWTLDGLSVLGHVALLLLLVLFLRSSHREHVGRLTAINLKLKQALRRAQDLTECSSDLVWEVDAQGRFTFVSDHRGVHRDVPGVRLGGCVAELRALDPITPAAAWDQQLAANRAGKPFRDFQYSARRSDGSIAHFRVNGVPILDEAGLVVGYRGTTRERTDEVEAMQRLSHLAMHDTLTGLPNRRALYEAIERCTASPDQPAAVLQLDLDGFKMVNDLHGHAAGDELLRLVAGRLRNAARPSDVVGRLGGDEFAAVLGAAGREDARAVGERIVESLSSPFVLNDGTTLRVGASVGVAMMPEDGTTPDHLLRGADRALYEAKHNGGHSLRFLEPAVEPPAGAAPSAALEAVRSAAALPAALRLAIARGHLSLAFQPIRRCGDGSLVSVEALLRWEDPDRGPVPPDTFIPVAEETGLIIQIGAWVLRRACETAVRAGGEWRIAVNISPVQFQQPDLAGMVANILRETGLPPGRLALELTEQIPLLRFPRAREAVRRLQAMGVQVALDDFGSGFSNIACLREFRFDLVKLDRSILALPPAQRGTVLTALLAVSQSFGLKVVVEGVETTEDWGMLQALGADYAQGYLLGRPAADLALAVPDAFPGQPLAPCSSPAGAFPP
ncbi:EAL domain-containing protein [Roseomonas sp. SSH11]|uniref:EAL domain-containing protein n=1 Tax=Pararoseomonas baculiformis TaxID=2820812 RepID=A0ABS4AIM5_9PROT|nr:EAL domain-containing protein [Pararoseomonas baculiformis]MBP0446882.1 EAL domain-containing protein [Pararoseomonas baculiformis]